MRRISSLRCAGKAMILPCLLALASLLAGARRAAAQTVSPVHDSQVAPSTGSAVQLGGGIPRQVLNGAAVQLGHYDSGQKLRLVMSIRPPHMEEEEQFIRDQQTKGPPSFHKFLTAEEWNARFAPSAEDEQKVVEWAQSQGLTVTRRYSHRLIVDLEGTVDSIERAFGVTINNYQIGDEVDFSNDRDPLLPATLSNIVTTVQGLNSIQREHGSAPGSENLKGLDYAPGPVISPGTTMQKDGDPAQLPANLKLNGNTAPTLSSTANSVPSLNNNGFMDPVNLFSSEAYNYGGLQALSHCCNVHNDSTGSPAVSSIAIAGWGNFLYSDIQGFQATYPYLAYNLTWYNIDGTPGCSKSTINPPCATGETTEDIEWSIATSNSLGSANDTSHVYAYLGGNFNLGTYTDIYSAILDDNSTRIMTTSWSCTENYDCGYDDGTIGVGQSTANDKSIIGSRHAIFNQMAGMGWTLISASGDRGAADDCQNGNSNPPSSTYVDPNAHTAVAYPASDSDFVAAGGTQISMNQDGTWSAERAWQGGFSDGSCQGNGGGSGGGVSVYFDQPSWQSKLSSLGSLRLVPDISLNARGQGQNLYINGGLNGDANGTSVVAPELAGFFAQENTYLNSIGNICGNGTEACAPVGLPTWEIYDAAIGGAHHDPFYNMLSGCSSNDATKQDGLKFFCAGPGYSLDVPGQPTQYNLVSGWGSVNMMQLAWAINWELIPAFGSPSLTFSGPAINTWYNTNQTVSWTLSDSGSSGFPAPGPAGFTQGWDTIPADPYSEPHGGTGNSFYSGPQFPYATSGCLAFDVNGCSGGSGQGCHTVKVEGWDNQGATTTGSYGPLCYDSVSPTIQVATSPAAPNANGWFTSPVQITISATDPGGSAASGLKQIYYKIGSGCQYNNLGGCVNYPLSFTESTQQVAALIAFSEDNAGNFSTIADQVLPIDYTPPVTSAGFSGPLIDDSYWQNSVSINLKGTDNVSGVAATYYKLDGSGKITYSSPITVNTVGTHTFSYWSVDNAGNTETTNTLTFQVVSSTATTLTSSLNPSLRGKAVTLTATVSATDAGTPTGTVTFVTASGKLGTGTLSGGVATLTLSSLPVGSDSISAQYSGAPNYSSSISATLTQVVQESTTTAVTATPNPVVYGSSTTLVATVRPAISGTPTGTVSFYDGTTFLGSAPLNGSAVASFSTSALPAGAQSVAAVYSGDSTYVGGTSAAYKVTVSKEGTTTAIASSLNPSLYGQAVTFQATVTAAEGIPTGSVNFIANGSTLGSESLVNGVAGFTTSKLALGTQSITASYTGSSNFNTSASSAVSEVVKAETTTTTLASSLNPSNYGEWITFTATVTTAAAGAPSGSVNFLSNGVKIGTQTLTNGVATFQTYQLPVGTNAITAAYVGTADYGASASAPLSQVVDKLTTTTSLTTTLSPSAFAQPVTFNATVSCGTVTPTGTVAFQAGGKNLGSGNLSAGIATFTTSSLPLGATSVTADYEGNTDCQPSVSGPVVESIVQAGTTTQVTSSLSPSTVGQAVTLTAAVTVPTGGTASGTASFFNGTTLLTTRTLSGGQVAYITTALPAGTDPIHVVYNGNADFAASTSATLNQVVDQAQTTTVLTTSVPSSAFGQPVTLKATVTSAGGVPSGTVAFEENGTTVASVTLSGGIATFTTSSLPVGVTTLTAKYEGNSGFLPSVSSALAETTDEAATTTQLTSSLNPATLGKSVTLTATLTPAATGTVTGTVTFMNGSTVIATKSLSGGKAVFATTALPVGSNSITALFAGNADYTASTSPALIQTVN